MSAVAWHRVLMPEVDRHVPRLPRSRVTVARTLCDLAALGQSERVFGGVLAVAERSAAHNGGRPLHWRTVQRALADLVAYGLIERLHRGGCGRRGLGARRGGRGIASIYAIGRLCRRRLSRVFRAAARGIGRNYGQTAVPESRDYIPVLPREEERPGGRGRLGITRPEAPLRQLLGALRGGEEAGGAPRGRDLTPRGRPAAHVHVLPGGRDTSEGGQ